VGRKFGPKKYGLLLFSLSYLMVKPAIALPPSSVEPMMSIEPRIKGGIATTDFKGRGGREEPVLYWTILFFPRLHNPLFTSIIYPNTTVYTLTDSSPTDRLMKRQDSDRSSADISPTNLFVRLCKSTWIPCHVVYLGNSDLTEVTLSLSVQEAIPTNLEAYNRRLGTIMANQIATTFCLCSPGRVRIIIDSPSKHQHVNFSTC
jgi:hypothetical protein